MLKQLQRQPLIVAPHCACVCTQLAESCYVAVLILGLVCRKRGMLIHLPSHYVHKGADRGQIVQFLTAHGLTSVPQKLFRVLRIC